MKFIRNLPNLLTLTNLLLGCAGIVYIYYDHMIINVSGEGTYIDMGKIHVTGILILVASFIDMSDGFIARILNVQSELGKQLDSLADMVTFGVVPGVILFNMISASFYGSQSAFEYPLALFLSGFLFTVCASIRLAKFNIDPDQQYEFKGMPSPAAAIFVASLPLILLTDETGISRFLQNQWILLGLTLFISYMMISPLPMMSVKFKSFKKGESKWQYIMLITLVLVLSIGLILNFKFLILPILIIVYILLSLTKKLIEDGI